MLQSAWGQNFWVVNQVVILSFFGPKGLIKLIPNWPSLSLVRRRRGLSSFRLQDLISFFKSASVNLPAAVKSEA